MSPSINLLDQIFNANDVVIMVFEPFDLFSFVWGREKMTWSGGTFSGKFPGMFRVSITSGEL